MKKNKLSVALVCLGASIVCLSGCENNEFNTDDGLEISSLLDGMTVLYQTKNYTLNIIHTTGSYREDIPSKIFTKNCIGYDGTNEDFDVLYNDETGIYHVSFADDYVSGEYILNDAGEKYTNLWDNSIVHTMYGVAGAYIKKNVKETTTNIEISDKDYKIGFLQTIVGNTNNYASVDKLIAKYENNKVTFDLSINNGSDLYKVTLSNVGSTVSNHLRTFINTDGKPFAPSSDLSEMRRLINLDNYVQSTYMITDGEGKWSGYQFFTPHYFFLTGVDPVVGYAYMEFDYKESPQLENDFDMWGIYMVNVDRDEEDKMQASLVSVNAYNSSTIEIEECCNYPSRKLDLLHNLEYVKSGEIRDANYELSKEFFEGETNKYYFVDQDLVNNFCNNFSLSTQFEGVIWNTVGIEIGLGEEDKKSLVCFHALGFYPEDGMTYDILIPLYGFGDAKRNALDYLYEQYNNNNN